MSDQVKPDQKIRLLPEVWAQIDEQKQLEGIKSRANMVEILIKRGFEHPITIYHKMPEVANVDEKSKLKINLPEQKGKLGNITFDPKIFNK